MCSLGIEPTTFALLTQCSTTEPQEHIIDTEVDLFPQMFRLVVDCQWHFSAVSLLLGLNQQSMLADLKPLANREAALMHWTPQLYLSDIHLVS